MTAVAFEHAVGSRWIVSIILAPLCFRCLRYSTETLLQPAACCLPWDGAGWWMRLARVHPRNQTPAAAVVWVGSRPRRCMFLGSAILVPISEVGSVASATGWFAACAAYLWMQPTRRQRMIASLGALVGLR